MAAQLFSFGSVTETTKKVLDTHEKTSLYSTQISKGFDSTEHRTAPLSVGKNLA